MAGEKEDGVATERVNRIPASHSGTLARWLEAYGRPFEAAVACIWV